MYFDFFLFVHFSLFFAQISFVPELRIFSHETVIMMVDELIGMVRKKEGIWIYEFFEIGNGTRCGGVRVVDESWVSN